MISDSLYVVIIESPNQISLIKSLLTEPNWLPLIEVWTTIPIVICELCHLPWVHILEGIISEVNTIGGSHIEQILGIVTATTCGWVGVILTVKNWIFYWDISIIRK